MPEVAKDEAWAASWLRLAGGAETPPEIATLAGELEVGRLATCWAENTCSTAFMNGTRKAGDMGDKTDKGMDRVVDAMLESSGAETDRRGIHKDSLKHRANDPQRTTSGTAHVMQWDTIALRVSRELPRRSLTVNDYVNETTFWCC